MDQSEKLEMTKDALFAALTIVMENNGNIMADAVHDHIMSSPSLITDRSVEDKGAEVERRIEESQ